MARPTQYPRQAVVQLTEAQAERIDDDAAKRGDGSKSAAHRRLLALGILLADELDAAMRVTGDPQPKRDVDEYVALLDAADKVR